MEASLRAPFILQWPGKAPAGRVSNEIVHITDLFCRSQLRTEHFLVRQTGLLSSEATASLPKHIGYTWSRVARSFDPTVLKPGKSPVNSLHSRCSPRFRCFCGAFHRAPQLLRSRLPSP